jgi:hypothetical protein
MKKQWYEGAKVLRQKDPKGRTVLIDVMVPHAYGQIKSVQVRPGDTNNFMADVIEGLLYELDTQPKKGGSNATSTQKV